jgi:hypothetical protein
MSLPSAVPPVPEITPARAYGRAHAGKLMVVEAKEGKVLATRDFFQFDQVGTHPTGLIVTGIFQDSHRAHMMAATVRDANAAEIAWLAAKGSE